MSPASLFRHAKDHLPVARASQEPAESEVSMPQEAEKDNLPGPKAENSVITGPDQTAPSVSTPASASSGAITTKLLTNHPRGIHGEVRAIYREAKAAGRLETALRAHKESRADIELIARLQGLMKDDSSSRSNELDLRSLSVEQIAELVRASLGELSVRDRTKLLAEAPELLELVPAGAAEELLSEVDDRVNVHGAQV